MWYLDAILVDVAISGRCRHGKDVKPLQRRSGREEWSQQRPVRRDFSIVSDTACLVTDALHFDIVMA